MPRPGLAFSHVGLYVIDIARMEDFYTRVLEFTVTDRGQLTTPHGPVELVFLSRDPDEHHQIVMVSGRPPEAQFNPINQISFRAPTLDALRTLRRRLDGERATELIEATHGNAISVYFRDPEGNRVEVFFDTPWYCRQPLREPIDLELPDAELMARAEAIARATPDFKPRAQWVAEMRARMGVA
jgi:catechol 2,3-dioxygenase-like lactoylglutathione lyase family enzyme